MNEKVKEILLNFKARPDDTCVFEVKDYAQQICQLFPKSPDNPDGYEPKAILDKGMGKIISKPKPDESRLLIPEELAVVFKKVNSMNALDYAKPIMEAQDTKTASIKDNDNILLLQYAEEKYPELLTDANWVNIKQSRWSQWQLDKVKESVNVTAIIKDAECQERINKAKKEERTRLLKQGLYTEKQIYAKLYNMMNNDPDKPMGILKKVLDTKIDESKSDTRKLCETECQERVMKLVNQLEQDIYALELELRIGDLTALYGLVQALKKKELK